MVVAVAIEKAVLLAVADVLVAVMVASADT